MYIYRVIRYRPRSMLSDSLDVLNSKHVVWWLLGFKGLGLLLLGFDYTLGWMNILGYKYIYMLMVHKLISWFSKVY